MARQVIEFYVVHESLEVKFRANSDTKISKVWYSYVQSRKWQGAKKARYRLFLNGSEGVRLSGTVQSNKIKEGTRLHVYELDTDEQCSITICDQNGNESTFGAWVEDDLEYWVEAFRATIWSQQGGQEPSGAPSAAQAQELYTLYDCSTRQKVDIPKGRGPILEEFMEVDGDEGALGGKARFLCFRHMPKPRASGSALTVAFWMWNGESINIDTDADTPLMEAVNACTAMRFGARAAASLPEGHIALFKRGVMFEPRWLRAGALRSRAYGGLLGDEDDGAEDEDASAELRRTVDVDYMCELCLGGSLQLAAWKDRVAGHPSLRMLAPSTFSTQVAGPLYLAAANGAANSVAALLEWGADPAAGNCGGAESAEYIAARNGHETLVRAMLSRAGGGAAVRGAALLALGKRLQQLVREMGGSRGLSLGCYCACLNACQRRLTLLTESTGRELVLSQQLSAVPLVAAARHGHLGVVREMLQAGYPPDVQDSIGETPLIAAASNGQAPIVHLLLASGANPSHRSLDGEQAIHAAAGAGSLECVRALLVAGADVDAQSELLLCAEEVSKLSGRKFRNATELGEWFRRQPRQSRTVMLDHAGILGGCTPLSLAVTGNHREVVMELLDAMGCNGKQALPKARADLLQSLLGLASGRGNGPMASLLLDRLQACGSSTTPDLGADLVACRVPAGAGARSRKAIRAASRPAGGPAAGQRGGGVARGAAAVGEDADGMFTLPDGLVGTSGQQPQQQPSQGLEKAAAAAGATEVLLSGRAARKARTRAARMAQAEEERQRQAERQRQQQQRQHRPEARVAEHAGAELREYIQQERQQLRRKLGLDQEDAAAAAAEISGGPVAGSSTARGAVEPAAGGGGEPGGPPEFHCRCCLREGALDPGLVEAASAVAAGGRGRDGVRCGVDPEHAAVGPRQRRLVVRCSGGCELDYHYPDCWRQLEVLLRAARPTFNGLKAKGNQALPTCWGPGCGGNVLSACVMEGPTDQPRFRQQLYTAPQQLAQQQAAAGGGGRGGGRQGKQQAAVAAAAAAAAAADSGSGGGGGAVSTAEPSNDKVVEGGRGWHRKGGGGHGRQKQWQEQSWYGEYGQYDDDCGGDELQEGDQGRPGDGEGEAGEGEGEGAAPEQPRAAELVDLSAVKLVPLSRRNEEVEAGIGGVGDGRGTHQQQQQTPLEELEGALLMGGSVRSGRRGKRGGGGGKTTKLLLTDLHKEDAAPTQGEGGGQAEQQGGQQAPARNSAWRDTSSVPFAVRPVWDRGAGGDGGGWDRGDAAFGNSASTADSYPQSDGYHPPNHGQQQQRASWGQAPPAVVPAGNGGGGAAGGGASAAACLPLPQMTEEEFPSLCPMSGQGLGPAGGGGAGAAAVVAPDDPIIGALQLLKIPGGDIFTSHLLLEGPCVRHLYTVLFRGRPRIADAQLSAILDRYGAMTAFQSFEDGAAVAVSFRTEDVASAVAAGLGAGDALGLLGPGSLAGAGGLQVSCLLEFPTDDALAREMIQAERAAGGGGGGGGGTVSRGTLRLKASAAPFAPASAAAVAAATAMMSAPSVVVATTPPQPPQPPPPRPTAAVGNGQAKAAASAAQPTMATGAAAPSTATAAAVAAQRMLATVAAARSTPSPPRQVPPGHAAAVSAALAKAVTSSPSAAFVAADILQRTFNGGTSGGGRGSRQDELPPAAAPPAAPPVVRIDATQPRSPSPNPLHRQPSAPSPPPLRAAAPAGPALQPPPPPAVTTASLTQAPAAACRAASLLTLRLTPAGSAAAAATTAAAPGALAGGFLAPADPSVAVAVPNPSAAPPASASHVMAATAVVATKAVKGPTVTAISEPVPAGSGAGAVAATPSLIMTTTIPLMGAAKAVAATAAPSAPAPAGTPAANIVAAHPVTRVQCSLGTAVTPWSPPVVASLAANHVVARVISAAPQRWCEASAAGRTPAVGAPAPFQTPTPASLMAMPWLAAHSPPVNQRANSATAITTAAGATAEAGQPTTANASLRVPPVPVPVVENGGQVVKPAAESGPEAAAAPVEVAAGVAAPGDGGGASEEAEEEMLADVLGLCLS